MEVALAFIQPKIRFGDFNHNIERISNLVEKLSSPDLIVLPELSFTGYLFSGREEAVELASKYGDASIEYGLKLSDRLSTAVVAGFAEYSDGKPYNSAYIVYKGELLGIYRKIHLFNEEKIWFEPGDQPPQVYEIGGFKVGVMICFDWIFPETARSLALQGADVIAHPSNLVFDYAYTAMLVRGRENTVYTVTANRVGVDRKGDKKLVFKGMSQITSPRMEIIYRARPYTEEAYEAYVDISLARDKWITKHNHVLMDRRPELYIGLKEETGVRERV